MNTQLRERPTTPTARTTAPEPRLRPVWGERGDRASESSHPTRRIRAWVAALAVAALAAVVGVVWAVAGGGSTPAPEPTQRPAFDSPGGNSLNIPAPGAGVEVQRPVFDSPGGNSLNIP